MMLQVDDPRDPESGLAFSVHKSLAWHAINFARIAQAQAHRRKTFFESVGDDNSALSLQHVHDLNCSRELH
jgi:hypothetical protein